MVEKLEGIRMGNFLLWTTSYIFDGFILYLFLEQYLQDRKPVFSKSGLLLGIAGVELFILLNTIWLGGNTGKWETLANVLISLGTTFVLTFMYEVSLKRRVFLSVMFQMLVGISELAFTCIILLIEPEILENITENTEYIMNFGSKLVLFAIIIVGISVY